ncbi:MAG: hypothetical protein LAO03_09775 [Acidobacteriia bacterium]|nr:hypothetical protein [Terriglobia bacterium]
MTMLRRMRNSFALRMLWVAVSVALLSLVCLAGKDFVMPAAQPAKTYPARDEHPTESVTVAVDPYDMADKASIFSIHYNELVFLPIFVVITNDGDQPVALADMKAQMVTVDRTKISPATVDDIYRRISHPSATGRTSPLPFPSKKVKGTVSSQQQDEMQRAQFAARAVEPHSTQSGFLFFDVTGISTPLAGAHFYLTGVRDAKGNELMYFEIPMEKYLSAPPAAH